MSFALLVPLLLALGMCFIPVWLLRRINLDQAQDYFVASQNTRPEVVRNASIAYAVRMAAFGPLFAWGASGDLWPAIIASLFFALGIYSIYLLRKPLLVFMDRALSRDQSITVHEFIAQQHGNDSRVRLLTASLTLFALMGLLVGEAVGVAAFVRAALPENANAVHLFMLGALVSTVLYATIAGHAGVMHSAQLQLGMLHLSLFGLTALLLYLHISALAPAPVHGTFAVVFVAACGAVMLYYRRSRYVDTNAIGGGRLLSRLEKILNIFITVMIVMVIVTATMQLSTAGLPTIVDNSIAALRVETSVPGVGLIALCLAPLCYPLVDVTNWQRLAGLRKSTQASVADADRGCDVLRRVFAMYAVESFLVWLFICMLGAIAVVAMQTQGGVNVLAIFVAQLVAHDNVVTAAALALLLIGVFAIALSTMSVLFSAGLCTIRYDIMPALWPELAPGHGQPSKETTARRRTLVAGGALGLVVVTVSGIADRFLPISFASSTFLAVLLAVACAQLAFAPLVLGAIVAHMRGRVGNLNAAWAMSVPVVGVTGSVAALAVYVTTGTEAWLWAAVPVCVGAAFMLFAVAAYLNARQIRMRTHS
ncbi:MAG TPA: hypothetical protein VNG69_17450 [Casimicrobiaceae bacterium]|nr:hypothetical protein [Casimicrobiaceae bacterium]